MSHTPLEKFEDLLKIFIRWHASCYYIKEYLIKYFYTLSSKFDKNYWETAQKAKLKIFRQAAGALLPTKDRYIVIFEN